MSASNIHNNVEPEPDFFDGDYDIVLDAVEAIQESPKSDVIVPVAAPQGERSVMPETMEAARSAAAASRGIIEDFSEASGVMVTGTVASKVLNKPSTEQVLSVANTGGAVSRQAGTFFADAMDALLPLVAQRIGAHQCDVCGARNLYNYYKATTTDVDLCLKCHPKWVSRDPTAFNERTKSLKFVLHDNTMFTLKLFGLALLALFVLKHGLSFVFGLFSGSRK